MSPEAQGILVQADSCVDLKAASEDHRIVIVDAIDSLYALGKVEEAMTLAESLAEQYPDNEAVSLALARLHIHRLQQMASQASDKQNSDLALDSFDSIVQFPGHVPGVNKERQSSIVPVKDATQPDLAPKPQFEVTPGLRKEAIKAYEEGQEAFALGQMEKAITAWEMVHRIIPDYQSTREYLVNALRLVGVELYGQRKRSEAISTWRRAAELDPENQEIPGIPGAHPKRNASTKGAYHWQQINKHLWLRAGHGQRYRTTLLSLLVPQF